MTGIAHRRVNERNASRESGARIFANLAHGGANSPRHPQTPLPIFSSSQPSDTINQSWVGAVERNEDF